MKTNHAIQIADPIPGVRVLTLNRPEAHNAINMKVAAALSAQLDADGKDEALRCLVITGAGDKAFSAGFDIREMAEFDAAAMREAFVRRDPLFLQIARHRLPVIAALNGLAYGAGALIAAACDFRVACAATRFKVTAIDYGSANATWSLPRLVGTARAKDILMTGRVVRPEEGIRIGLFDRFAPNENALDQALALAGQIAAKPPDGIRAVKDLIDRSHIRSNEEAWQAEHDAMLRTFEAGQRGGAEIFNRFLSKGQH